MAFSEAERVQIRRYMGYARLNYQFDPRLENTLTTVQATSDGGAFPDNTTELLIRGVLADLAALETKLKALWDQAQAVDADGLKIEVPRAMVMLRAEGRRLVGAIADALDMRPKRDAFSSPAMRLE